MRSWLDGLEPSSASAGTPEPPPELRDHLARCDACAHQLEAWLELGRSLQGLPAELSPERDLWPGIEARLDRAPRLVVADDGPRDERPSAEAPRRPVVWWSGWAAAAAVLALAVGAWMLGLVPENGEAHRAAVEGPPEAASPGGPVAVPAAGPGGDPAGARSAQRRLERLDDQYSRARRELEVAFAARRAELSPTTLAVVERNLAILEEAVAELRTALAADGAAPDPALEQLLVAQYQRQLDLLRRVQDLPATDAAG